MVEHYQEPIATYVNNEPAALAGVTYSELSVVVIVAVAVWVPITILLLLAGASVFAPVIGLIGVASTTAALAAMLRRVKRNRPDRYYVHRLRRWWLTRFGSSQIIVRDGWWSTGRTLARSRQRRPSTPRS